MNLWTSFQTAFLSEGKYENLSSGSLISVPLIVVGLFLGVAIALVVNVFTKRVLGAPVRKLLSENATSADAAKTLAELGVDKNWFLAHAFRGNVSLRRVVRCREEDEFLKAQEEKACAEENPKKAKKLRAETFRVDPKVHHFYIPEEYRDMATVKFDKKGTSIVSLVILLLALFVALLVLLLVLPRLMGLVDDFVGTMKSAASSNDKIV